jgi:lysophospholipase L1-like esterase
MAQACAARPGCTFADAGVAVTDAAGGLDPRYHIGDGLHLNGLGNRAWRAALAPALAPWRHI